MGIFSDVGEFRCFSFSERPCAKNMPIANIYVCSGENDKQICRYVFKLYESMSVGWSDKLESIGSGLPRRDENNVD